MPPKKKKEAISGPSTQTNKRSLESGLNRLAKRQKYADDTSPSEGIVRDSYCWICHELGKDIGCKDCQRMYHSQCLDEVSQEFSDGTCPECQLKSLDNVGLTVNNLREVLSVVIKEFRRKVKSQDLFIQWRNVDERKIVKKMDLHLLVDNIEDVNEPYKCLAEIVSDIKWIHHNYCIIDGVDSGTAKEAESFVRTFQKEISDVEDCPKCYKHMFEDKRKDDFFVKICDPPHDIVWAWLKGSCPWPAKCLRVKNGKAHVRFFGTHDKSNIPIGNKKCLAISLHHPTHKNSKLTDNNLVPKKRDYRIAVDELLVYIDRYNKKFTEKFKFYEIGTPYKGEFIKPSRKKRNKDRRNVSNVSPPEENVLPPPSPPTASFLNESNEQDVQAEEIEVINLIDDTGFNNHLNDYLALSVDHSPESINGDCILLPTPSPVVTASMECEVASSDDSPPTYSGPPALYSRPTSVSSGGGGDDDVTYLNSYRRPRNVQPSAVLNYILHESPDLQSLFRQGNCVFDSLFVRIWAAANRKRHAPELIKKLFKECKMLALQKLEIVQQKENVKIENNLLRMKVAKLTEDFESLKTNYDAVKNKLLEAEVNYQKAIENANTVCQGLFKVYRAKFQGADLNLIEAKEIDLQEQKAEVKRLNLLLQEAIKEQQQGKKELKKKEDLIEKLRSSLDLLKIEMETARNHEVGEAYIVKLEEFFNLHVEKLFRIVKQLEVKGIVTESLSDLRLIRLEKPSSSGAEAPEKSPPSNVCENISGSSKKTSQNSSSKSQGIHHRRITHDSEATTATDQQFCQQMISQEAHVKTIARKTSVNIEVGHSKTITTTRNEGNMIGFHRPPALYGSHFPTTTSAAVTVPLPIIYGQPPEAMAAVNAAYDLSQHIAHRERYHVHSPSNLVPNPRGRDRHYKDSRKKQSRYSHHDKI